jgi:diaminopimelate decarboxylase
MRAGFSRVEGQILCDGVPLEEAARSFGTPLYVYSAALLRESYLAYARAFPEPHRVCYALKANPLGALLRILAGLGAGADIVSGGELRAALRAGFPRERIVFAGVGKTDDELRLGIEEGVGVVNVESEEEIRRLSALSSRAGRVVAFALRVNPAIDPGSHPHISTGLRESKFGLPIALAGGIAERTRSLPGVRLVGVQSHIGSQILDLGPIGEAAGALAALSRELLSAGFPLETIDLGGGLGVDYEGGAPVAPESLARTVADALGGLPLRILIEPGRSLVGTAGVLVTRVLGEKENGGRRFLVVDAGMNDFLRPALYDAHHRVESVVALGREPRVVDVVGPVCESADFLARGRSLEALPGELLAVRDTGAYGFSMSSQYNLRPRAAEVVVDHGAPRLARRRETFEDLVATEVPAP